MCSCVVLSYVYCLPLHTSIFHIIEGNIYERKLTELTHLLSGVCLCNHVSWPLLLKPVWLSLDISLPSPPPSPKGNLANIAVSLLQTLFIKLVPCKWGCRKLLPCKWGLPQSFTMQISFSENLPQPFTTQMRFATTLRQPHLHYLNGCWKFKQTCCGDVLANFWRCSGEHLAIFWRCFFNHMNNRALAYLKVVLTREM